MPKSKITKQRVDGLAAGETLWDTELTGFGVRRQRGKPVYILKKRVNGIQRQFQIGQHGSPWTPERARKEALRLLYEIYSGTDPAKIRDEKPKTTLIQDLCVRYLEDYALPHKKESSAQEDERLVRNHVIPLIGQLDLKTVTTEDIERFASNVRSGEHLPSNRNHRLDCQVGTVARGGPGAANRSLALLSKMFNLAEKWSLRPGGSNPVRHVTRYKEKKKERFLIADELARLSSTIKRIEETKSASPYAIAAIKLLMLTGARKSEILELKWEYIDFERKLIHLLDSKTGKKPIYLSDVAIDVLHDVPRMEGNPYVIVGAKAGAHLVNLRKTWCRVCDDAEIDGVRLHDLRHTFASFGASSGLSLLMIGRLLSHKRLTTTERYAHLLDDPVREANEIISSSIIDALR